MVDNSRISSNGSFNRFQLVPPALLGITGVCPSAMKDVTRLDLLSGLL